jgi:hypothetical protein
MRRIEFIHEFIDDDGNYVKSKGVKEDVIGFYLRFIGEHFKPCRQCQKELAKLIETPDHLILGNKEYEPPVELYRKFEIDESAWIQLEKRKPTKEELERLKL